MALLKKTYVCPYCFSKNDLYTIQFRCQNAPSKCAHEEDIKYASFREIPSFKMGHVFDVDKKGLSSLLIPKTANCPNCKNESHMRICPDCHSELPYTIGNFDDLIFSFIGSKESGKSHYISVLINTIKNQIGSAFNANLNSLDDNTKTKYRELFYNPIFKQKELIPETISARGDYNVKMPMVFSLLFLKKNLFGKEKINSVSTISFFDTAGEDLNSEDTMKTENKYIYNSSGIVLLIDPLQIDEVRGILASKGISLPKTHTDPEDIISRLVKLIRLSNKLKQNEQIKIPLAVTFSKIDALTPILTDSSMFDPGNHNGYFNKVDAENINTEIETLLGSWTGSSLIQLIRANFENYAFFGVSALGSNPHGGDKIEKLRPIRVEDPFLWLLYKNGIVKGK